MSDKFYKYALICNDCKQNKVSILYVTITESDAIDYLTKFINNNYKLDNFLKAYYDDEKTISIYRYYYVSSKELIFKYQILTFCDPLIHDSIL